jgi:hypothetical protein
MAASTAASRSRQVDRARRARPCARNVFGDAAVSGAWVGAGTSSCDEGRRTFVTRGSKKRHRMAGIPPVIGQAFDLNDPFLDQPAHRFAHRLDRPIARAIAEHALRLGDTAIGAVRDVIVGLRRLQLAGNPTVLCPPRIDVLGFMSRGYFLHEPAAPSNWRAAGEKDRTQSDPRKADAETRRMRREAALPPFGPTQTSAPRLASRRSVLDADWGRTPRRFAHGERCSLGQRLD